MKQILTICLLLPLFIAGQSAPADSIIRIESLQQTIAMLAHDSLEGRMTGTAGMLRAAVFIEEQFLSLGLIPMPDSTGYADLFPLEGRDKRIGANMIGMLPGNVSNDTMVIFSAHYDHIGTAATVLSLAARQSQAGDDIFNGANDNATGVAAMIEIARYYSVQKTNRYRLVFIAFAGEEMGLIGSTAYSKKIDLHKVKAVINLEMLGRPADKECFIISSGNGKLKQLLNQRLKRSYPTGRNFFFSDPYPDETLFKRSDHYPFTSKVKYAFTIMASSPTDEFYHSPGDEYETIDFDFLLEATRKIALASEYFTL